MALLRGAYGFSLRKSRKFLLEVFGGKFSHGALSAKEARLSFLSRTIARAQRGQTPPLIALGR